jgi:hypothetical protein
MERKKITAFFQLESAKISLSNAEETIKTKFVTKEEIIQGRKYEEYLTLRDKIKYLFEEYNKQVTDNKYNDTNLLTDIETKISKIKQEISEIDKIEDIENLESKVISNVSDSNDIIWLVDKFRIYGDDKEKPKNIQEMLNKIEELSLNVKEMGTKLKKKQLLILEKTRKSLCEYFCPPPTIDNDKNEKLLPKVDGRKIKSKRSIKKKKSKSKKKSRRRYI